MNIAELPLSLSTLITSLAGSKNTTSKELLHYSAVQTLEKSGLTMDVQNEIMEKLRGPIAKLSTTDVIAVFNEYNLVNEFASQTRWFSTPRGQKFIQKDLPGLELLKVTGKGKIPSAINWKTLNQKNMPNHLVNLKEKLSKKLNLPTDLINMDYVGGIEAKFDVEGIGTQVSRSHHLKFNIPESKLSFDFQFYEPSSHGLLAQTNDSITKGFSKSNTIFSVPSEFYTPERISPTELGLKSIKGGDSYVKFQEEVFEQFGGRLKELQANTSMSYKEKEVALKELVSDYKKQITKFQNYVNKASEIKGVDPRFGVEHLNQGKMSRVSLHTNQAVYFDDLLKISEKFDLGDKRPIELMVADGIDFGVSSKQAGTLKGIRKEWRGHGAKILPHEEPYKAMSDLTPANLKLDPNIPNTTLPQHVNLFKDKESQLVSGKIADAHFNPPGTQLTTSFFPVEEKMIKELAVDGGVDIESGQMVNTLFPDGVAYTSTEAYKTGALDILESKSYTIASKGPGGVINAQVGKKVNDLISAMDKHKLPLYEAAEKEGLLKNGILPLEPGEMLGMEPGSPRSVTSINNLNVSEMITDITQDQHGNYDISVARRTGYELDKASGEVISHHEKFLGSSLSKEGKSYKFINERMSPDQYIKNIKNSVNVSDTAIKEMASAQHWAQADVLQNPMDRLMQMSGAAKLQVSNQHVDYLKEIGAAKEEQRLINKTLSPEDKVAIENIKGTKQVQQTMALSEEIVQMSNSQLLEELADGTMLTKMNKSNLAGTKQKQVLAKDSGYSLDAKLASFTEGMYKHQPLPVKEEAIKKVMSPHGKWGQEWGLEPSKMAKTYYDWGGKAEAKEWHQGKRIQAELNEALSYGNMNKTNRILSGDSFMGTIEGSIKEANIMLGDGGRGTVEPRLFDVAMSSKEMQPVMKEISGRMTDYTPALKKIGNVLKGTEPVGLDSYSIADVLKDKNIIGSKDISLDLGFDKQTRSEINHMINKLDGNLGAKMPSKLYIPGGADFKDTGFMTLGSGSVKAKPTREIFDTYINNINKAKSFTPKAMHKHVAESTIDFYKNMVDLHKKAYTGIPKGGASGFRRGAAKGSRSMRRLGLGADFQEIIGAVPSTRELTKQQQAFRANIQETLSGSSPELLGDQYIVSSTALDKTFADASSHHEEMLLKSLPEKEKLYHEKMIETFKEQRQTLKRGGSILAADIRHPGIGPKSISPIRVWEDSWSPDTTTAEYSRSAQQFVDVKASGKVSSKLQATMPSRVQTGLAANLHGDWDADYDSMFLLADEQAQQGLSTAIQERHRHAIRYEGIKTIAQSSVDYHGQIRKDALTETFLDQLEQFKIEPNNPTANDVFDTYFKDQTESVIKAAQVQEVNSALALGAPTQLVPQISNTFTEFKSVVAMSEKLGSTQKGDILRFLEITEQLPISSRKLVSNMESAKQMIHQTHKLKAGMFSASKEIRDKSLTSFFELYGTDPGTGSLAENLILETKNTGIKQAEHVNMKSILNDSITALNEFHSNESNVKFAQLFNKSTRGHKSSIDETIKVFESQLENLNKVHSNTQNIIENAAISKTATASSKEIVRGTQQVINEGIENAAKFAENKLPTKGIIGVATLTAASLLAVGAAGLALAPSFKDGASGGRFVNEDYLFPDQMEAVNKTLHGGSISTPVTGQLINNSYNAQIHLPPGAQNPTNLANKFSLLVQNRFMGQGTLRLDDNRMQMDSHTLSRIKNEII